MLVVAVTAVVLLLVVALSVLLLAFPPWRRSQIKQTCFHGKW